MRLSSDQFLGQPAGGSGPSCEKANPVSGQLLPVGRPGRAGPSPGAGRRNRTQDPWRQRRAPGGSGQRSPSTVRFGRRQGRVLQAAGTSRDRPRPDCGSLLLVGHQQPGELPGLLAAALPLRDGQPCRLDGRAQTRWQLGAGPHPVGRAGPHGPLRPVGDGGLRRRAGLSVRPVGGLPEPLPARLVQLDSGVRGPQCHPPDRGLLGVSHRHHPSPAMDGPG